MNKARIVKEYKWKSGPKGITEEYSVKIKLSRKAAWEELSPETAAAAGICPLNQSSPTLEELRRIAICGVSEKTSPPNLSRSCTWGAGARDMQNPQRILPTCAPNFPAENLADELTRALQGEDPENRDQGDQTDV